MFYPMSERYYAASGNMWGAKYRKNGKTCIHLMGNTNEATIVFQSCVFSSWKWEGDWRQVPEVAAMKSFSFHTVNHVCFKFPGGDDMRRLLCKLSNDNRSYHAPLMRLEINRHISRACWRASVLGGARGGCVCVCGVLVKDVEVVAKWLIGITVARQTPSRSLWR